MTKLIATFEEIQADGALDELSQMNLDGVDWRVYRPGDNERAGAPAIPVVADTTGTGTQGSAGGPAIGPAILGLAGNDLAGPGDNAALDDDVADYIERARARGAVVVAVRAPAEAESAVRQIFARHDAANISSG